MKAKKHTNVLIDCEKVKYPNTGLFSFCTQLANAIEKVKMEYTIETQYLITKKCLKYLPSYTFRIITLIDKLFFFTNKNTDVFHATFQLGKFFPRNKKIVLTIHDLNFLYEKSEEKAIKLKKKVQRNIDKAAHLVAISQFAKEDVLKHLNIGNKPFDVIYNGCSFYEGPTIEQPSYLPKGDFIFSIGTVLPKKNFHVLPTLLLNNNLTLIIAGNKSSYQEVIKEEAEKYGVENRVKIIGPINESDKDWYYRNCLAFVFPSIAEGFGLPVIEALHYGKPTFISKHTSLPEIGKDYCYYFDYNFNPEKMRTEFTNGLAHFKQRNINELIDYAHSFSWENAAKQYCEIYQSLALKK